MGKTLDPISVLTAPFQIFTSAWENERNIEAQRNNNRINREWQHNENVLDRDFQAQQQESLLNSQQDFQREMFKLQNEYNLPSNQIARLRAAGLNPAALLGGSGGLAAASGNSSSVPSVPSAPGAIGSHSVQQSPQIQTPMSSIAQMFSSIAQLQDSVSNAKRQGAEVSKIETMLPKEADKIEAETGVMISQKRLNDATAAVTEFNHMLQDMFGKDEKAAEVQKLMNDSYSLFAKGQLDEAQTVYTQGLNMLNELDYKIKKEQYPQLIQQATLYNDLIKAQKVTEEAKQANEYASSKEHIAGAELKTAEKDRIDKLVDEELAKVKADKNVKIQVAKQIKQLINLNKPDELEAAIEYQMKHSSPAATGCWLALRGLLKALPFSANVSKSTTVHTGD